MRNTSKMTTLENKFPLLAVEHGCIVSKDADLTVAYEVELPELYTVTGAEYEAIHGCWCKAIKVLPDYSIVHKQDWFIKEQYKPELHKDDMSFLSRSFERHFNERPYLKHTCYLFLTKTTKERNRMQSNFSTLCRGHIIPKDLYRETAEKFVEATEQFARIMNDSGFIRLRRLSTDEIVGTEDKAGLIERYFSLMPEGDRTLQDIDLSAREMRIGSENSCHRCKRNRIRTGQWTGRHQRSHLHGHLVFRPRHETHLRHRRSGRTHRRREGLWQVLVGRPRHLQDRRKLVRSVYLPHRGSHHPALVLPII